MGKDRLAMLGQAPNYREPVWVSGRGVWGMGEAEAVVFM